MLTEKDYCDYETCVALKKLGYKEKTLAYYTSEGIFYWRRAYIYDVAIPDLAKSSNKELYKHVLDAVSLYEAQKWLREVKKIDVFVRAGYLGKNRVRHYFVEVFTSKDVITLDNDREDFDSYEEALLEGIKEAVKILKENEI